MSILRMLLLVIAVTLLCSCSSWRDWRVQKGVERSRAEALAKIDQEQCRAEGGSIRGVGMFGTPACVKPFADAGKLCLTNLNAKVFARLRTRQRLDRDLLAFARKTPMIITGATTK